MRHFMGEFVLWSWIKTTLSYSPNFLKIGNFCFDHKDYEKCGPHLLKNREVWKPISALSCDIIYKWIKYKYTCININIYIHMHRVGWATERGGGARGEEEGLSLFSSRFPPPLWRSLYSHSWHTFNLTAFATKALETTHKGC